MTGDQLPIQNVGSCYTSTERKIKRYSRQSDLRPSSEAGCQTVGSRLPIFLQTVVRTVYLEATQSSGAATKTAQSPLTSQAPRGNSIVVTTRSREVKASPPRHSERYFDL